MSDDQPGQKDTTEDEKARMDDEGGPPPAEPPADTARPAIPAEAAPATAASDHRFPASSEPSVSPSASGEPKAATDPDDGLSAGTPSRRPPLVPILIATSAVLLVATILLGLMAFAPRIAPIKTTATKLAAKAMEEEEIEAIARRFATNFVSIDYRTIDAGLKRMQADATGNFREQLGRTIEAIGAQFKARKASSKGKALDSAVLSHEDGTALVQVLLQRTKTNVGTKGPESGNQIVNVSLVKTDNGWKVDDLSQQGAEGAS